MLWNLILCLFGWHKVFIKLKVEFYDFHKNRYNCVSTYYILNIEFWFKYRKEEFVFVIQLKNPFFSIHQRFQTLLLSESIYSFPQEFFHNLVVLNRIKTMFNSFNNSTILQLILFEDQILPLFYVTVISHLMFNIITVSINSESSKSYKTLNWNVSQY